MVFGSKYFPVAGLRRQAKAQLAAPTASFSGQTILIAGASGEIFSEAARMLVDLGVDTLVFGVRSLDKGEALAEELKKRRRGAESQGLKVLVWMLEMSSCESVIQFVTQAQELPRLDVAVMGAATISLKRTVTPDGWETSENNRSSTFVGPRDVPGPDIVHSISLK